MCLRTARAGREEDFVVWVVLPGAVLLPTAGVLAGGVIALPGGDFRAGVFFDAEELLVEDEDPAGRVFFPAGSTL